MNHVGIYIKKLDQTLDIYLRIIDALCNHKYIFICISLNFISISPWYLTKQVRLLFAENGTFPNQITWHRQVLPIIVRDRTRVPGMMKEKINREVPGA